MQLPAQITLAIKIIPEHFFFYQSTLKDTIGVGLDHCKMDCYKALQNSRMLSCTAQHSKCRCGTGGQQRDPQLAFCHSRRTVG